MRLVDISLQVPLRLECLCGIREIMGPNSVGNLLFFFVQ